MSLSLQLPQMILAVGIVRVRIYSENRITMFPDLELMNILLGAFMKKHWRHVLGRIKTYDNSPYPQKIEHCLLDAVALQS
jgi:hypothetical protein